ncbi:MAG TPA: alpha/beta hydrolase-fold protein [Verrucomicrobiae bacterium]|nr:alpha/beta hydrolase-fold protein [Verrucomicrobiae bacterium]
MLAALVLVAGNYIAPAQTNQPADDWKPAPSNMPGQQYPEVNSQGRVRARIRAPQAQNVQLDISGNKFPMTKNADGFWMGDSTPQDQGNHYYGFAVDGAEVPDPNGSFIFGSGAWRTDVEIPASDQEIYALKSVPHGQLREIYYFGKTSDTIRHSFVYTPPGYDKNPNQRYPVLYLLHGYNENESGWGHQGRAGFIMDNLIAAGKAVPFIIVMENGGISTRPGFTPRGASPTGAPSRGRGRGMFDFSDFEHALIEDVIPYIDANFRTIPDQPHRALAGFSMGGMQTHSIALKHLDTFAYIGIFSGGSISTNEIKDLTGFKQKVKLVFVSYGSRELGGGGGRGPLFGGNPQADIAGLQAAGINARFYVSPDTAHEWQTWRRSLHEFAPLLFEKP